MNHIYKVIWNKAKHCYTVVSEIAKSHSQSNKRVRSMTAVVAAAMMLTGFGGMAIEAANPASGDTNITIGKGASVSIWNGVPGHDGVTSGYISIGENAFAWDGEHTYKDKYARIGTKEYLLDFNQGAVSGAESFFGIPYKYRVTDGTKLAGAIAIGKNTMARTGSVMIGDHTYKGQLGDIEVDPSNKQTLNNGVYSTTLGTSSYNSGSMATVTGAFSIASGNKYTNDTQNFGATIYGSLNSIESSTTSDSASGMANSVLGFGNRTQNANASLVWGTGNEVTNSIEDVNFSTNWNKTSASDAQKEIIKAMQSDQFAGGSVMAIGGGNKADWATYSQLLGVKNTLIGENGAVSKYDMINGYKNEVTNATHTSIIGSNNKAKNIQSTTVMGDNNDLTGNGNHVIGDNHKVTGKNNILIGNNKEQKTHSGSDSVIIGNNASAGNGSMAMGNEAHAGNTGIALGMKASAGDGQNLAIGYYADVSGATNSTALGYASKVEKRDILSSDGKDGVVSVGKSVGQSGEAGITRRIINVKAGVKDTDAVNVSQLKGVNAEALKHSTVTNGDANITVTEGFNKDGGKEYKVALNNDITLAGDDPDAFVSISGTNGTIEATGFIATKDKIYADKGAKLADVNVTGDTISNDKSSVKLDKDGTVTINNRVTIDQSGKISGVAAGEISSTSTDAVNGSQLKATNDRVSRVEGDITNIKSDITDIKGDVKNLGDRVTKVEQEAGKHTKVVNGSNVTVEETDQDGQKTYKVGLNKDLLLGDITGKNVSISGTNGTIKTTGSIATKDKIYADKGAKLADIDITGDTISNDKSSVKLDKNGTVTINNKVTVDQDGKVSGVAAGEISATSTDAVNGSQLFETKQQVAQSISKLGNRINKVGAGAAALAALHPLDFDPDDKWDFAAGYGNYNGENAAAVGAYYRPNEDTMFSVGGSFGNGENMVNAGVSLKLGQGNHVSTSKVAMAKEIKDLRKEMEGLKSALLDANAGKKLDTSKLQLFPDVPKNHWAYEYVSTLKGNGALTGYPDGEFKGDRPMTRYEFATMLYKAMLEGATLSDKILKEFAPELERFTVDTVHQDKDGKPTVERVRTVKAKK